MNLPPKLTVYETRSNMHTHIHAHLHVCSFTLREGMGARRLAKFKSHASVQLLLVQGCSEVYAQLHRLLPPSATAQLLKALAQVGCGCAL